MSYQTLAEPCHALLTIKKSDFLAYAYPITNREQAMIFVEQLKQQYPDARHHCWAYIIGNPQNTTSAGFDDDGEPSGTAGKPILNVLQHKKIGNCLVVVVRYFGGIKLGAGGLTRAYSQATQMVVDNMILTEFIAMTTLTITTDFANEGFIRHLLSNVSAEILNVKYTNDVVLTVQLPTIDVTDLQEKIGFYGTIQSDSVQH